MVLRGFAESLIAQPAEMDTTSTPHAPGEYRAEHLKRAAKELHEKQLAFLAESPQLPATMVVQGMVRGKLPFQVIDAMRKGLHSKESSPGNELRAHVISEYFGFHDLANYQAVKHRMRNLTLLHFLQQHTDSPDFYVATIASDAAERLLRFEPQQDITAAELHSFTAVTFAENLVDWELLANRLLDEN